MCRKPQLKVLPVSHSFTHSLAHSLTHWLPSEMIATIDVGSFPSRQVSKSLFLGYLLFDVCICNGAEELFLMLLPLQLLLLLTL